MNLINKYNKSVDSIKSQELAIDKVKNKLSELNYQVESAGGLSKVSYKTAQSMDELNSKLGIMESKLSQTKDEANQTRQNIEKMLKAKTMKPFNASLDEVKNKISDVNDNVKRFGKRISNLVASALIFNVLSGGLRALRENFTSLLKTDDQFSSSLNQIKANLMTAFVPIYNAVLPAINSLMTALSKVTGTIAQFVASLFGMNLKQASNQAKKLSKSLNSVSKSGDKASGSLASFDKLEVISETDTSSGTSAGTKNDEIDFSGEIQTSQRLLDFLNKIKDFISENKENIIAFLFGVAAGILAIKLNCKLLQSTGIFLLVMGIVGAIQSLVEYLKDPTWENFWKMVQYIGEAIIGLGLVIGNLPVVVIGVAVLILATIAKHWEQIKGLLDKAINFIYDHMDDIKKRFEIVGEVVATIFISLITIIKTLFGDLFSGVKQIFDGIIKIIKGDFKGGIKEVFGGLGKILLAPFNALWQGVKVILNYLIDGFNKLISGVNKISFDVPDWVPAIGGQKWGFNIPKIPKLAQGAVIPPRQEFMAILGDQKHGTNIETPLETMKQAFREVLNEFKGLSDNEREIVFRNLTFIAQFGNKTFQKLVVDSLRAEEKATGTTLLLN